LLKVVLKANPLLRIPLGTLGFEVNDIEDIEEDAEIN
jgi:hypothetical protein